MDKDKKKKLEDTALLSHETINPNHELGITKEYNKANRDALWDSAKRKTEYKNKQFGDKQTYKDPISGKVLHKNQSAAQRKYHMKNRSGENISKKWAEHSAESDHIATLDGSQGVAKHNAFLTDNDFKKTMNRDENFRLLSKSMNASKGASSDVKLVLDPKNGLSMKARGEIAKGKIRSEVTVHGEFAARTAKNIGSEFSKGAKNSLESSVVSLTAIAVNNMVEVAKGEIELGEAAKDTGKSVVKVAALGGMEQLAADILANSEMKMLQAVTDAAGMGIVRAAVMIGSAAVRYVNGNIDGEMFVQEVVKNGAVIIVTDIAAAATGPLGLVLAPIITTVACDVIFSVFNTIHHMNDYKITEKQINRLESEALGEMARQRQKFAEIVEKEFQDMDNTVNTGFGLIFSGIGKGEQGLDDITEGLDTILSVFGKSVAFKTNEEYLAQLDQPLYFNF